MSVASSRRSQLRPDGDGSGENSLKRFLVNTFMGSFDFAQDDKELETLEQDKAQVNQASIAAPPLAVVYFSDCGKAN